MDTSLPRKCVVGGVLEDGMSFTFTFCVMFSSDNFGDIGLDDGTTSVINTVNGGVSDGGTFGVFLFFGRGPVDDIVAFFEAWDGVSFRESAFVFLPGGAGFGHGIFAGETVFL